MIKAIKAKYIITSNGEPLRNSSVIVNGSFIQDIIPNSKLEKKKYKIIDLKNSILMPGFINAHIHLELYWVNKLLEPFNSFPSWLNQIIKLKGDFDPSKIKKSVQKSLNESIESGVTTIGEIASYDGLDYELIIKSGIRAVYFYEITNSTFSRIKGEFLTRILSKEANSLFDLRIFPHSIYSLDTKLFKSILAFAKKKKIKVGTHLSESIDEVRYAKKLKNNLEDKVFCNMAKKPEQMKDPSSPLEYLHKINSHGHDIALVHMNNLSKEDFVILNKHQYPVILCPRSNSYLTQKLPNLKFFIDYKKTGLGTDGLSSNLSIDFLEEINFLYLSIKNIIKGPAEKKVLDIATIGGARALGIDNSVGSIKKNKKADLIAFDLINQDPYLSVVHSKKKHLKMSMIDGKIIKLR